MSNAPGLRDQRIRVYAKEESGADGYTRPVYRYVNTYWGRLDLVFATQRINPSPQQSSSYQSDGRATLNYRAEVPNDGLLKVDGNVYYVRGVVRERLLWETNVDISVVDTDTFATFEVFDPEDVKDGEHLVDPESA